MTAPFELVGVFIMDWMREILFLYSFAKKKLGPRCKIPQNNFTQGTILRHKLIIELSMSQFCWKHCQRENNKNWQFYHLYPYYVYLCLAGSFWPYLLCDNFILLVYRSHSLSNIFNDWPQISRLWCDNLMSWVTFLHVESIPHVQTFQ